MAAPHTPTPWQWTCPDKSAAVLHRAGDFDTPVLASKPCQACIEDVEMQDWKWGRCLTPSEADAAFIVRAANGFDGLTAFAREIIECAFDGSDADGASIQALAVTHGLLVETEYDPDKHGPSMESEPGDQWFVLAGPLAAAEGRS